jgi:hypothetical protein
MFPLVYHIGFKIVLTILVGSWAVFCAFNTVLEPTFKNRWSLTNKQLLLTTVAVFWVVRLLYSLGDAHEMDMNTWMASAITVAKSPDVIWTLLNYSDGRPLTVLPLVALEWAGFQIDFRIVEMLGVSIWTITFYMLGRILNRQTLGILLGVILWLSSVWMTGLTAYNSEIICCFFMVIALRMSQNIASNMFFTLFFGIWLGCFPIIKFQIIPMGLLLGLWQCRILLIAHNYTKLAGLIMGALLPIGFVTSYYVWHNKFDILWNDYFYNYFVYAYTDEFSDTPLLERFSVRHIFTFITGANQSMIFWSTIVASSLFAVMLVFYKRALRTPQMILGSLWWIITLYAVLQAGNLFGHYLFLLLMPTLWVLNESQIVFKRQKIAWHFIIIFMLITGQTIANTYTRYQLAPIKNPTLVNDITKEITHLTNATEKVVVWGYTDELYVYTRRMMGYRSPYTFWVYFPSSQQSFRIQEFIDDLKENKPKLFVDAFNDHLVDSYHKQGHWQNIPKVKAYIDGHYTQVSKVEDVLFYVRR